MAMLETGYALRAGADFLVGSEELESAEGWDYSDWCQALVDKPSIGGSEFKQVTRGLVQAKTC
jgi:hypothetical protein